MLRELLKIYRSESLVFIDKQGFEEFQACLYAWSKKGNKFCGDRQVKRGKIENLVPGKRKKNFIVPMVFARSLNTESFEGCLSLYLLPFRTHSININYGLIYRKTGIRKLVEWQVIQYCFCQNILLN